MASGNWYFESKSTAKRQLSKHALKRGCQRGISELSVPLITAYGEKEHDGKGGHSLPHDICCHHKSPSSGRLYPASRRAPKYVCRGEL